MFYDTHTHLNDPKLHEDLEGVIERAQAAQVLKMNAVGYDWPSSLMSVRLAEKYPGLVYAIVGVHPYDADKCDAALCDRLAALAADPTVVAVGELGLDYYRDITPKDVQKQALIAQIDLAKQLRKPIVIHDREAHGDIVKILRQEQAGVNGGIIHCFSGSWEMVQDCIKMGFHISFAGPLTYKNARNLQQVAQKVPLERLLIETDCPYLSPHPYRGQTNEPARVTVVAAKVAELKNLDLEEVAKATTNNAYQLFGL